MQLYAFRRNVVVIQVFENTVVFAVHLFPVIAMLPDPHPVIQSAHIDGQHRALQPAPLPETITTCDLVLETIDKPLPV